MYFCFRKASKPKALKAIIMIKRFLPAFILLLFLTTSTSLLAQRKYSNEFLNIGVGAQAHGMSNAMTAHTNDIYSTFWNPAGLTKIEAPFEIGLMHAEWFRSIAKYDYLGFAKTLNSESKSVLGVSLIRLGIDDIPNTLNLVEPDGTINYDNVTSFSTADYAFLVSYGREIDFKGRTLSVGGNAKVIRRVVGSFGSAWGFGIDLGVQYQAGNWQLGFVGKDITSTFNAWSFSLNDQEQQVFTATGNDIPESTLEITRPTFVFGAAYRFNFGEDYSLMPALDFRITTDGQRNVLVNSKAFNLDPVFGFEFSYRKFLFLRGGVGNFQRSLDDVGGEEVLTLQPNFGVGVKLGRIRLDYAYTNVGNVSDVLYSNIFSLVLDLKRKKRYYDN